MTERKGWGKGNAKSLTIHYFPSFSKTSLCGLVARGGLIFDEPIAETFVCEICRKKFKEQNV